MTVPVTRPLASRLPAPEAAGARARGRALCPSDSARRARDRDAVTCPAAPAAPATEREPGLPGSDFGLGLGVPQQ